MQPASGKGRNSNFSLYTIDPSLLLITEPNPTQYSSTGADAVPPQSKGITFPYFEETSVIVFPPKDAIHTPLV